MTGVPQLRSVSPGQKSLLRRMALGDEATIAPMMAGTATRTATSAEARTLALARIAALVGMTSSPPAFQLAVDLALASGASDRQIVEVLIAVAPIVGSARATSAASELALALGYDIGPIDRH